MVQHLVNGLSKTSLLRNDMNKVCEHPTLWDYTAYVAVGIQSDSDDTKQASGEGSSNRPNI